LPANSRTEKVFGARPGSSVSRQFHRLKPGLQHPPVERKVALKIIKPGMDSRQIIARFEAERQALALMEHPNIAKVRDGGTTPATRPYFVMELVKGVPITRFCDEHRRIPKERLELLMYDGKPVPKVIDFGVAKANGPKLTEVVGTLEYMSPEQAELDQLDIDT
jgi:eukaryotic-like serine/threonine-protein kinase